MLDPEVEIRILKSLNFKEGDRVPIWDLIDNSNVYEHFAHEEADPLKAAVKVYHGLGIDLCRGYVTPYPPEDNGKREILPSGNYWGPAVGTSQELIISGQTRWLINRPFRNLEDISKFQVEFPTEEELREVEFVRYQKEKEAFEPWTLFIYTAMCCINIPYHLIGLKLFSIALYDTPAKIAHIINAFADDSYRRAKIFAEKRLAPIYFLADDIAYKGGLIFSPAILRKYWLPNLKRIITPLKKVGIKVIFHSDGNLMEILDDLIEAGIDGLNPIEPLEGMDIGYLKRKYYGKLVLVGNIDCSQLLPFRSKEEIIGAVKQCLRVASPGGGHFIGSSSEITPSTPLENVLTFYQAIKEYGKYPIQV